RPAPSAIAVLGVVEVDQPLRGPGHLDDEPERFAQEGFEIVLLAQPQQPQIEVALTTEPRVGPVRTVRHRSTSVTPSGRRMEIFSLGARSKFGECHLGRDLVEYDL